MSFASDTDMATLTIKNFPDDLYANLTKIAKRNRRSINNEAIISVERGLDRPDIDRDLLERIRQRREEMASNGVWLTDEILAQSRAELLERPREVMRELDVKAPASRKRRVRTG